MKRFFGLAVILMLFTNVFCSYGVNTAVNSGMKMYLINENSYGGGYYLSSNIEFNYQKWLFMSGVSLEENKIFTTVKKFYVPEIYGGINLRMPFLNFINLNFLGGIKSLVYSNNYFDNLYYFARFKSEIEISFWILKFKIGESISANYRIFSKENFTETFDECFIYAGLGCDF